jgi:hypothetical protein
MRHTIAKGTLSNNPLIASDLPVYRFARNSPSRKLTMPTGIPNTRYSQFILFTAYRYGLLRLIGLLNVFVSR